MKSLPLGVLVALALTACMPASPPQTSFTPPPATVTVTAPPEPTPTPSAEVCDYGIMSDGNIAILISSWDLVKASRGQGDHEHFLGSFVDRVEAMQEHEDDDCTGSAELAVLGSLADLVRVTYAALGEDDEESYRQIADAGNAWFDAIGHTKYRFSIEPDDFGMDEITGSED